VEQLAHCLGNVSLGDKKYSGPQEVIFQFWELVLAFNAIKQSVKMSCVTHAILLPTHFVGHFLMFPVTSGRLQFHQLCRLTELLSPPWNSQQLFIFP
jgi:hypothetical protein